MWLWLCQGKKDLHLIGILWSTSTDEPLEAWTTLRGCVLRWISDAHAYHNSSKPPRRFEAESVPNITVDSVWFYFPIHGKIPSRHLWSVKRRKGFTRYKYRDRQGRTSLWTHKQMCSDTYENPSHTPTYSISLGFFVNTMYSEQLFQSHSCKHIYTFRSGTTDTHGQSTKNLERR